MGRGCRVMPEEAGHPACKTTNSSGELLMNLNKTQVHGNFAQIVHRTARPAPFPCVTSATMKGPTRMRQDHPTRWSSATVYFDHFLCRTPRDVQPSRPDSGSRLPLWAPPGAECPLLCWQDAFLRTPGGGCGEGGHRGKSHRQGACPGCTLSHALSLLALTLSPGGGVRSPRGYPVPPLGRKSLCTAHT